MEPRRSNLDKSLKNKLACRHFCTVKHRGFGGVIYILFRLNNVKGLYKGRNYSAGVRKKNMLGIYDGAGGQGGEEHGGEEH